MENPKKTHTIPVEVHTLERLTNYFLLIYPNGNRRIVSVRKFVSMVVEQGVIV